jgi:outer membrane protein assembly factor BamD
MKSTDYEYKLKKADEFYHAKKYSQAVLIYEDIFPVLKGTAQFEDLYWNYAFSHYYMKDYLNAENLFKGFMENFPTSARAEEASFLRAYCYFKQSPKPDLDQTSTMKAINFLQTFTMRHPQSEKNKEAYDIIESLRKKLEAKEKRSADLYYNLGYYKASASAYSELLYNFPDSEFSDEYKLMVIKSYYEYAKKSITAKQLERYEQVLDECADFTDRFPDSKLISDVTKYKNLSENQIKNIKNEQDKETT